MDTEVNSQMEFRPAMNIRAITAKRPIVLNLDETGSNRSMITEETNAPKSQGISAGFQSQTQKTSVLSNQKRKNTKFNGDKPSTEITETSFLISSTRVPNITETTASSHKNYSKQFRYSSGNKYI